MTKSSKKKIYRVCYVLVFLFLIGLLIWLFFNVFKPQYEIKIQEDKQRNEVLTWLDDGRGNFSEIPNASVPEETKGSDAPAETTAPMASEPGKRYQDLYDAAVEYNKKVHRDGITGLGDIDYEEGSSVQPNYDNPAFDLPAYGIEDEIFGAVSIPKINVILPLYLGATYQHMAKGFAQMGNTSIPIGGEGTNAVLACHRGWRRMAYLRDVEMLDIGDKVYVHNLWEDLTYEIVDTHVVYPSDLSILTIQEDRDLITLFTCHPYGVSNRRYVVVCERVAEETCDDLMTSHDVKDEIAKNEQAYMSGIVQSAGTSTVMTSDGEVDSSQGTLFLWVYLPWILFFFLIVFVVIYVVFQIICYFWRKHKKTKARKTLKVRIM